MAKARIRKAGGGTTRIVGPTLFTERTVQSRVEGEPARVYYEAWRLRSDGWIQSRIVRTFPARGEVGYTTEHSSAFTNWRRFKAGEAATHANLVKVLERIKADVVKESYR